MPSPEEAGRKPQFSEVQQLLTGYLNDSSVGNPYDTVTGYFSDQYSKDNGGWTPQASNEAVLLLEAMRAAYSGQRPDNSPHTTPGTIVFGLPGFYPLNLGVLSYLLYGEIDMATEESASATQAKLRHFAERYDPAGYDLTRSNRTIDRLPDKFAPTPLPTTETLPIAQTPHRRWFDRLLGR